MVKAGVIVSFVEVLPLRSENRALGKDFSASQRIKLLLQGFAQTGV